MHRLGLRIGWACDFGNDEFSSYVLCQSKKEGLDSDLFVKHRQALRHITIAASYPQDRAFISFTDQSPIIPAGFLALLRTTGRILFVPGLYYGRWFEIGVRLAKLRGMKIVMDGNSSEESLDNTPALEGILCKLDIFMPNASEAARITGKNSVSEATEMLSRFCPLVVVKDGANGAFAGVNGHLTHAQALPVQPVETTGAGDCFNAGFVKAWLDGLSLEICLKWGNIVGGLSTLAEGGTSYWIDQQVAKEWLNRD